MKTTNDHDRYARLAHGDENDLPEGWVETTLDELLVQLETGSRPKGGVRHIAEGIPSVGGEHLADNGGFRFEKVKFVPKDFYERMSRGQIHKGDVLVVKDGATTAKVSIVRDDFPYAKAVVNEHVFICRPATGVNSHFLFWFLFSQEGQRRILENFQGSAQGGINQGFAPGTAVPLAPCPEQKRIVAKVEALLERVNAARARLARLPAILKRFRQSVLAAACSGQLTAEWREGKNLEPTDQLLTRLRAARPTKAELGVEFPVKRWRVAAPRQAQLDDLPIIPETWAWVYLPDLGYMNRGRSRNRPRNAPHLYGGKYPFIQTGDIAQSGGRIVSHKQTYSEAGLAQSRSWPAGTICITIAANIADSAILTYSACFPDSVVGLITDSELCVAEFAEFFVRTAREDLSQFAPATAQKNINIGILEEVAVPLPPLEEQREIVRRVEALFALADGIEARVPAATVRAERLTQAILAKAFRGELVPTEADLARQQGRDYESADQLLARIQAERRALGGSGRPKRKRVGRAS